jgi:hypothetical protein
MLASKYMSFCSTGLDFVSVRKVNITVNPSTLQSKYHRLRIILLYLHFCLHLSYMHRCVRLIMLYLRIASAKFIVVFVPRKTNSFILPYVPHSTVCCMLSYSNYTSQFEPMTRKLCPQVTGCSNSTNAN